MSRRTKLLITALFLVLLAIPTAYIAFTWSPTAALRFRVEHIAPPSKGKPHADRKVRISIENTSSIPVYFYGAVMMEDRPRATLPAPKPGDFVFVRDLMSGIVAPELLKKDLPFDADYPFLVPAFLLLDASVGAPLIIPAHSTVRVPALLPAKFVNSTPPRDIFVHYHWETKTHVTARNVADWLRHHTPTPARKLIPKLSHRQDITPLQSLPK